MLWLRFTLAMRLAEHACGNDDAHAKNRRGSHNGSGDVFILDDFLFQMSWRTQVKDLESDDGSGDADGCKDEYIGNG
jgi:hypothetical protein